MNLCFLPNEAKRISMLKFLALTQKQLVAGKSLRLALTFSGSCLEQSKLVALLIKFNFHFIKFVFRLCFLSERDLPMVKPCRITSVGRFIVINASYTYSGITMEKTCPVHGCCSHIKVALCQEALFVTQPRSNSNFSPTYSSILPTIQVSLRSPPPRPHPSPVLCIN